MLGDMAPKPVTRNLFLSDQEFFCFIVWKRFGGHVHVKLRWVVVVVELRQPQCGHAA
jgi:hypothetical protein